MKSAALHRHASPVAAAAGARDRTAPRRITAFTAACLLVSNTVGSGIFTTTGFLARELGDAVAILCVWVVGAALALAGALSYAELGAALPRSGGEYIYLRRAYGPFIAFLSGWTSFAFGFGGAIAASAVGFASLAAGLMPAGSHIDASVLALLLVWVLSVVHLQGVERGGQLQRWLTSLKVGGIIAFVLASVTAGDGSWDHFEMAAGSPRGMSFLVALIFVSYAFSGWNAAAYVAGEIEEPQRNLPRALVGGTCAVAILYLAINLLYIYALPVSDMASEPVLPIAEKAAAALFGASAGGLVAALVCVSIAAATSAMIWAGPRVYAAMAVDGLAPVWISRDDPITPRRAILLQAAWVSLLITTRTFEQLVIASGAALAVFSGVAVAAVIVLRRGEPDLPRPFRVPGYPWVPAAYVGVSLLIAGAALVERPGESSLAITAVALAAPLYLWRRTR